MFLFQLVKKELSAVDARKVFRKNRKGRNKTDHRQKTTSIENLAQRVVCLEEKLKNLNVDLNTDGPADLAIDRPHQ